MLRKFVSFCLAALALLAMTACGPTGQPETVSWRLQTHSYRGSVDFAALQTFAENVARMSEGRFTISIHEGGELANGPDIFRAVSDGRIEMGNGWPNWWSGQHPAWAVMNAGPFDFMNLDASMMFFFEGKGTELANELSLPLGVIWRPAWWSGMEFGLLSKTPIYGLDDLEGKRMRFGPGLPSEVMAEASGAYTIPLVPQEILPALRDGSIEMVEWANPSGVLDLGIHEECRYALIPAIWQPSVLSDFLINEEAYGRLSPDLQQILESAMRDFSLKATLESKLSDFAAIESMKEMGMELNVWSDSDIQRWRRANDTIVERYRREDEFSKRLIDAKQAFKARYDSYYEFYQAYE
ncbi:TRAP transporter substrate-binding protein DctP [Pelagicoccus sp. SDUM812003]|uniref:TRAP transporter substrate-binding protein DctP n=1 Tax=Pelagicoccus sp. SDUM812003 TaxID=3041267 RepID=UPI00280D72E8|nr:TRAP transporter substrate-binding protein DctP [Pelagicoccus sp. SDUM812003]MDQ8203278.1 TRAP transporter substrate-binding protein DctP [Pelagicoccus sp. SDUM812003]